jgi:hypothetical protein
VTNKRTGTPITPLPVYGAQPGDRICYKVKCPNHPTNQSVTDQFGTRTLSKFKASLVCTPAFRGPARFIDNGNGTVTDNSTGLQWEKKDGASEGPAGNLHDVDNPYTWAGRCTNGDLCQPNQAASDTCFAQAEDGTLGCALCAAGAADCDVNPEGFLGVITTVWDWINRVNAENFAGHSDWRLPSEAGQNQCSTCDPRELDGIRLEPFPCLRLPCIDPIFGPTASSLYWSATSSATSPPFAWFVDFSIPSFFENAVHKNSGVHVRAVRGGS